MPVPKRRRPHPARHTRSAGGVAYRYVEQAGRKIVQIALIATRGGQRWQLPKGTLEPDETPVQTAIREVAEETGLQTDHEAFLRTIAYVYHNTYRREVPELVHKKVDFYLLRVVGGSLSDDSYEVDGVAWCTPDEALEKLTFAEEREVVRQALEHWQ